MPGSDPFTVCVGPGTISVHTREQSRNPYMPDTTERLLVYDTRTGKQTVSTVVASGIESLTDFSPGRVVYREKGQDSSRLTD